MIFLQADLTELPPERPDRIGSRALEMKFVVENLTIGD
jgi:hypothetical protein